MYRTAVLTVCTCLLSAALAHGQEVSEVLWTTPGTGATTVWSSDLAGGTARDLATSSESGQPKGIDVGLTTDESTSYVFWIDTSSSSGSIPSAIYYRTMQEGAVVNDLPIPTCQNDGDFAACLLGEGTGIAVDLNGGKVYWTDRDTFSNPRKGRISRANLDGTGAEVLVDDNDVICGFFLPTGIALDLDRGQMYWATDNGQGRIMRANLDGLDCEVFSLTAGSIPVDLAIDSGNDYIYYSDTGVDQIRRMDLDGVIDTGFSIAATNPGDIDLNLCEGEVYWAEGGARIRKANLDGTSPQTVRQDTASSGVKGLAIYECNDGNPCTDDSCDAMQMCLFTPNDNNPCCEQGQPGCDDIIVCTDDTCDGTECVHTPDDTQCVEIPCNSVACDSQLGCVYSPAFEDDMCDDDNACTVGTTCDADGNCVGGTEPDCEENPPDLCTDDSCDPAQGACVHTPKDPVSLLNQLVMDVMMCNLQNGIANSLDAKLSNALSALDDMNTNNDGAAVNKINAFINEVQAQSGNKIPEDKAAEFIAAAEAIIFVIENCP